MATTFYLNDCLPSQPSGGVNVPQLFQQMVLEYKELHKNPVLNLAQNWATTDDVDNVTLCSMKLRDLLNEMKTNPMLFAYACKLVTDKMPLIYEELQMAADPELGFSFEFNGRNAHYLLVAQKLDMIAASLPVETGLSKNDLELIYTDPMTGNQTKKLICNWYINNKTIITQLLTPPLPPKTDPWNRLHALLGKGGRKVEYSNVFKKDWDSLGSGMQQLIVQRFEDALNAGLLFPAKGTNKKLVRPDEKDKTSKVHELKQKGTGFRVYFECDADAIYIALYGSKTIHHGKDQEADFKLAKVIVERLREGVK